MDKLTELVDAVERRTLSIDRDKAEEEAITLQVTAVVDALRRLVTACQDASLHHDALAQAEEALEADDGIHEDVDAEAGPQ